MNKKQCWRNTAGYVEYVEEMDRQYFAVGILFQAAA